MITGCAMGSYGPILARYTYTPSAVVIDVYAGGLDVRPTGPDAGATAGFRHASYIFARRGPCDADEIGTTTWRWFRAPWPAALPIVQGVTAIGLEAQITPHMRRLAAGYLDGLVTVGPSRDESVMAEIRYDRLAPERTYVKITWEEHDASSTTC